MVRFVLAIASFAAILNGVFSAPSDLNVVPYQNRMKRQFGNQDSSLQQTLQGLQMTQQQQGNRRPGQSGNFGSQSTNGQGFGGSGNGGFSSGQSQGFGRPQISNNNQGTGFTSGQSQGGFISGQPQSSNNNQGTGFTSGQSQGTGLTSGQSQGSGITSNQNGFGTGQSQGSGTGQSTGGFQTQNSGSSQGQGFGQTNNQGGFNTNQGSIGNNQQSSNGMTTIRYPLNVVTNENSLDPPIRDCIRQRCPSTNQYNPVCGDDNITYTNRQKLMCAQQCNRQVQEVYQGSCVTTPAPNRK